MKILGKLLILFHYTPLHWFLNRMYNSYLSPKGIVYTSKEIDKMLKTGNRFAVEINEGEML